MTLATAPTSRPETQQTALAQSLAKLETVVDQCSLATLANQGRFERAFTLARGIAQLRKMITPEMMGEIMELQGSSMGFRTDQDKGGGYSVDVVKECLIESVLRGLNPVGNEFNIIASRTYTTKEGYTRLVGELPGMTDLKEQYGVPKMMNGGAIVACSASWKIDERPDRIECEIPVRVNTGMGTDAILGKATRKLLARVYKQVTGSEQSEGDVDDAPARPVTSTVIDSGKTRSQQLASRLGPSRQIGNEPPLEPAASAAPTSGAPASGEAVNTDTGEVTDTDAQPEAPAEESQVADLPQTLPKNCTLDWINDVITAAKPEGMTAHAAREKFHDLDTAAWPVIGRARQAEKYMGLRDGTIWETQNAV